MLPLRWQTEISVRSYELDFYGVVNNAVYLHYLEEARLDLLRQLGIDFFKMAAEGTVPVVARATGIPVMSIRDIIASKRAAGRKRDLADLELLESFREVYEASKARTKS